MTASARAENVGSLRWCLGRVLCRVRLGAVPPALTSDHLWLWLDVVFVSGSFIPAIPRVARDLGSEGSVIRCVLAWYMTNSFLAYCSHTLLSVSLSACPYLPMRAALSSGRPIRATVCPRPLSLFRLSSTHPTGTVLDGRRPIYLCALPLLALGSLGTASAQSVVQLMACRVIQGLGSSAGMSTGAAVVGDIYKLEERGTAMGIFFGVRFSLTIHWREESKSD